MPFTPISKRQRNRSWNVEQYMQVIQAGVNANEYAHVGIDVVRGRGGAAAVPSVGNLIREDDDE